jgi:rod shape-determining protein MreB and related proteins
VLEQAIGRLSTDLAVDLGTSNTRVFVRGRGITVEAPSVVATDRNAGGRVVAVGEEAKRMLGRTPEHITAIGPIRDGIIADFALAEALLRDCVESAVPGRRLVRPNMVVCVPQATSDVERRAVQDFARAVGARHVQLVAKSVAAAVGAELPIHEAVGTALIDLGGGITEVVVLSLGGVVDSTTIRAAGDTLDGAIAAWVRDHHNVLIGGRSAEEVKLAVGCAQTLDTPGTARITGRDLTSGIPREVEVTSDDVLAAVRPSLHVIVEGVRQVLSRISAELAGDIADNGLVLTGGTALLPGFDRFLSQETGLPVVVADDPKRATAIGAGMLLEDPETLDRVAL